MKSSNERRPYRMGARATETAATRERIVRAALELWLDQPYEDVTLAAIATASGVSHQTVLNHFESKEGVAFAAADLLQVQTSAARAAAAPGDVRGAVNLLVDEYERIGEANARWAVASERLGNLASKLDEARAGHQDWLRHIFAEWLPSGSGARRRMVNALHAATDVYTWKLLRRDLRLSRDETQAVMCDLVHGVVAGGSAPHPRSRSGGGGG